MARGLGSEMDNPRRALLRLLILAGARLVKEQDGDADPDADPDPDADGTCCPVIVACRRTKACAADMQALEPSYVESSCEKADLFTVFTVYTVPYRLLQSRSPAVPQSRSPTSLRVGPGMV
ncbi:hypothetical protein DHEL01_v208986 [Diaporthe helianthi]|uniref:Uncharacterized protein n=1 Tax=Diaporthe helianthi TaxID=158607 RepID=A0A2P5HQS9_DIAHE|nr:hypothetical protein DHEL01_v208986 [Diaporthe helianthi]